MDSKKSHKNIRTKIVIIGAGICGLYLAWKLAEKGHFVTVFEKKGRVGKRACSGLLSKRIFDFFPSAESLVQNRINRCKIHFPRANINLNLRNEFILVERARLDCLAGEYAEKAGAKIVFNADIKNLPSGFDFIIGCDGYDSAVRRILGLSNPSLKLALQGFVKENDYSDCVDVWPQNDRGFVWRIPRGQAVEYGVFGDPLRVKINFEKFLKEYHLNLENAESAAIPQGLSLPNNEKIILCGNAAGLTKPWSGGGVIWGLTACRIILEHFPDFLLASKKIKSFFVPEIVVSKGLAKLTYFLGFHLPFTLPGEFSFDGDFFFGKKYENL